MHTYISSDKVKFQRIKSEERRGWRMGSIKFLHMLVHLKIQAPKREEPPKIRWLPYKL